METRAKSLIEESIIVYYSDEIVAMSDTCEVLAAVTVEGLAYFGQSPVVSAYVCATAGVYASPVAPIVCGSAALATAVGQWAVTPSGKALMSKAAEDGCNIVVRGGELLLVKGGEMKDKFKKTAEEADKTYRALNTEQGVRWLMRILSGY